VVNGWRLTESKTLIFSILRHIKSAQPPLFLFTGKKVAILFSKTSANFSFFVENNNPHFEIAWFLLHLLVQPANRITYFM